MTVKSRRHSDTSLLLVVGGKKGSDPSSPSSWHSLTSVAEVGLETRNDLKAEKCSTWRECFSGALLTIAFVACTAAFFMLGTQDHNGSGASCTQIDMSGMICDAVVDSVQQQLLAFMMKKESQFFDNEDDTVGSCSVHFCPEESFVNSFVDEIILYLLFFGAILTVVGVTVLLYDDPEKGTLKAVTNSSASAELVSMDCSVSEHGAWVAKKNREPTADLFPHVTLLNADVVGFDAWSSQREPSQCLTLLERVYEGFSRLEKDQGIFRVDTVGEFYSAALGLPEPLPDHAEAMIRFARDCIKSFRATTKSLEVSLGVDTSDLAIRIGIHSGPVTALHGGRSRFQLFGDTVTTTTATLHTSYAGRIQLTKETVDLLPVRVRSKWVSTREQLVNVKGEQTVASYWVTMPDQHVGGQSRFERVSEETQDTLSRMVDWNVQILKRLLNQIVSKRHAAQAARSSNTEPVDAQTVEKKWPHGILVIDEVEEVIKLPRYDDTVAKAQAKQQSIQVSDQVVEQLTEYVTEIAKRYKSSNSFHNFEHASHVTMSVTKLLSRIVAPNASSMQSSGTKLDDQQLHDHTYGITSDPLTQFGCIFSALIHDVEHDGVSNAQLVKEGSPLASQFNGRSVAEQNSVTVGWNLLMESRFKELRHAIYNNDDEMAHFRQLIVNCVMATDICDKQLKDLRNLRWERAFKAQSVESSPGPIILEEDVNRKATIVIEHLLQASDVSHTMQHFNVFRKFNEKLFMEMYFAYKDGRSAVDPATFWYKGEIGFFEFYVIPLARKLKECGVFGVSSDEYLNYALKNKAEWEQKGREISEALLEKAERAYALARGKEWGNVQSAPSA